MEVNPSLEQWCNAYPVILSHAMFQIKYNISQNKVWIEYHLDLNTPSKYQAFWEKL